MSVLSVTAFTVVFSFEMSRSILLWISPCFASSPASSAATASLNRALIVSYSVICCCKAGDFDVSFLTGVKPARSADGRLVVGEAGVPVLFFVRSTLAEDREAVVLVRRDDRGVPDDVVGALDVVFEGVRGAPAVERLVAGFRSVVEGVIVDLRSAPVVDLPASLEEAVEDKDVLFAAPVIPSLLLSSLELATPLPFSSAELLIEGRVLRVVVVVGGAGLRVAEVPVGRIGGLFKELPVVPRVGAVPGLVVLDVADAVGLFAVPVATGRFGAVAVSFGGEEADVVSLALSELIAGCSSAEVSIAAVSGTSSGASSVTGSVPGSVSEESAIGFGSSTDAIL